MSIARRALKLTMLAGLLAVILPAAEAAQPGRQPGPSTPRQATPQDPAVQAQTQRALNEGTVAGNRAAAIQTILGKWQNSLQGAEHTARFQSVLNAATNRMLAEMLTATSFEQVQSILVGGTSDVSGGVGIQNLGDATNDLVYTPINPPCRAFDSRVAPNVLHAGGTTTNYILWGAVGGQGGNPAGCPNPKGFIGPLAASLNVTAVPVGIQGHIRVFPYLAALPTVSFVNFNGVVGNNIANAGIISMCPGVCAEDISVYNGSTTHHLGDVMGFFYAVSAADPALKQVKDVAYRSDGSVPSIPSDNVLRMTPSFTTHTTAAGDIVHITSTQNFGTTTALFFGSNLDLFPCYRVSPAGGLITLGGGMFDLTIEANVINTRQEYTVTGVATPGAGTFNFGMCYRSSDIGWVNNEWGYTSTIVLNPL